MSVKVIVLGGVNFYPTTIETEDVRVAESRRMLGGAMRMWHRAFKKQWNVHWENVPETTVSGIRTRYRQTSSQTYTDQDLTVYTVITTTFKETLNAEDISLPGTYYYDIDLAFEEV